MFQKANVRHRLKALRKEAGLTIREVAEALAMQPTSYQHYEDRYKKQYIPLELAQSLALVLMPKGVEPDQVLSLAGYNRSLDMAGDEGEELGTEPDKLGPDGKLRPALVHDENQRTQAPLDNAENTFSVGYDHDFVVVSARVDSKNLDRLIKHLAAIRDGVI